MTLVLPSFSDAHIVEIPSTILLVEADASTELRALLALIPELTALASRSLVAIAGEVRPQRAAGLLDRMMGRNKGRSIERCVRCTALLAKGYTQIGGGVDSKGIDWAYGWTP